jgi:hypothetical protein
MVWSEVGADYRHLFGRIGASVPPTALVAPAAVVNA